MFNMYWYYLGGIITGYLLFIVYLAGTEQTLISKKEKKEYEVLKHEVAKESEKKS